MNNLLKTENVQAGKIYIVDLIEQGTKTLRIITETPSHYIFVKEDEDGCNVFEVDKNKIKGIYEIKDWYQNQENIETN